MNNSTVPVTVTPAEPQAGTLPPVGAADGRDRDRRAIRRCRLLIMNQLGHDLPVPHA